IGDGPTPLDPGRATAGFNGMSNVDRRGDGFRPYALVVNAVNHNDLLLGWDQVYTSSNQGNTVTPRQGPGAAKVTALAYGGRDANGTSVPQAAYVARGSVISSFDDIAPVAGAAVATATFDTRGAGITSIAMDPGNRRVAYAVGGSQVYVTVNAGASWQPLASASGAGALPQQTLNTVQVIATDPLKYADVLLVGGSQGLFRLTRPLGDRLLTQPPLVPVPAPASVVVTIPGDNN